MDLHQATNRLQATNGQSSSPASTGQSNPAAGNSGASFADTLSQAQQSYRPTPPPAPPTNRWQQLGFLKSLSSPRIPNTWTRTFIAGLNLPNLPTAAGAQFGRSMATAVTSTAPAAPVAPTTPPALTGTPMTLDQYPRPVNDNGWGIHWIPTVSQSPAEVDRYVAQARQMGMKWVLFLNEGTQIGRNDYLVRKLTEAGIEPMMRIYTDGLSPLDTEALQDTVAHYTDLGVRYVQLYNEPNLMVETHGAPPSVDRYLDLWIPAAEATIAGGGLPGFGALSPMGEFDDRRFLRESLAELKARGKADLLNTGWLSMHNYTGPLALEHPDGFRRFEQYNDIISQELGRQMPIIGTEGGTHVTEHVSPEQQIAMVTGAYDYMRSQREPYNFAYTYWIIANGHDPAWDEHVMSPQLVEALRTMAADA